MLTYTFSDPEKKNKKNNPEAENPHGRPSVPAGLCHVFLGLQASSRVTASRPYIS